MLEARGPRPDAERATDPRAAARGARAPRAPALDDKRLTTWNALMIAALADAGAVLGEPRYLDAAGASAEFVLGELRDRDGRLLRTFNAGARACRAYLEDHAFLLEALLTLYEASFEERWFVGARALADVLIARFADPERGGFFSTAADDEPLITRRKDLEDTPIPSGSSSAALGLLRLARADRRGGLRGARAARRWRSRTSSRPATRSPSATCCARSTSTPPPRARSRSSGAPEGARRRSRPSCASARARASCWRRRRRSEQPSAVPLLEGRSAPRRAAGRLRLRALRLPGPVSEPAQLAALLDGASQARRLTGSAGSGRAPSA